jgi:diacylglycerol kinase family enzyme
VMPCIRKFLHFSAPRITISIDGEQIIKNQKGWIIVANSPAYARGLNPARNASITDGLLDVVFLPIQSRSSLLTWMLRVKLGTHLQHKSAIELRGKNTKINTSSPTHWQLDGDSHYEDQTTQLDIVAHQNSLAIITP